MGCSKCSARARNRTQYRVISKDGKRTLYGPVTDQRTAEMVSKRYPGSTVKATGPSAS